MSETSVNPNKDTSISKIELSHFMDKTKHIPPSSDSKLSKDHKKLSSSTKKSSSSASPKKRSNSELADDVVEEHHSLDLFNNRLSAFEKKIKARAILRSDSMESLRSYLLEKLEELVSDTIVVRLKKKVEKDGHYLLWVVLYTHYSFFCSLAFHLVWNKEKKQIYMHKKLEETTVNLPLPNTSPLFFVDFMPFLTSEDYIEYEANLQEENVLVPSLHPYVLRHQLHYNPSHSKNGNHHNNHTPHHHQSPQNNKNHPKYYKNRKHNSKNVKNVRGMKDIKNKVDYSNNTHQKHHKHKHHNNKHNNHKHHNTTNRHNHKHHNSNHHNITNRRPNERKDRKIKKFYHPKNQNRLISKIEHKPQPSKRNASISLSSAEEWDSSSLSLTGKSPS